MPKLLELFCGTKSIGKEFARAGFDVISMDFKPEFDPTVCADILTLPNDHFCGLGIDAVWASFPCEAFSVMVIGKNWDKATNAPRTDAARLGLAILTKTKAIVEAIRSENPDAMVWYENPRAKARHFMTEYHRDTVTYCQYGDTRMKPTDIWHNTAWVPRPICFNGAPCHEAAPRGSRTGTQGVKGARLRSVIPSELCREIAEYAAANVGSQPVPIQPDQAPLWGEECDMQRIVRDRMLTPEEVAKYDLVRSQVAADLPGLLARAGMSASQIIQRIHEEASRRELHATHDLYRRAIARQKTWNKLTPENRRRVLDMMEGDFNFCRHRPRGCIDMSKLRTFVDRVDMSRRRSKPDAQTIAVPTDLAIAARDYIATRIEKAVEGGRKSRGHRYQNVPESQLSQTPRAIRERERRRLARETPHLR